MNINSNLFTSGFLFIHFPSIKLEDGNVNEGNLLIRNTYYEEVITCELKKKKNQLGIFGEGAIYKPKGQERGCPILVGGEFKCTLPYIEGIIEANPTLKSLIEKLKRWSGNYHVLGTKKQREAMKHYWEYMASSNQEVASQKLEKYLADNNLVIDQGIKYDRAFFNPMPKAEWLEYLTIITKLLETKSPDFVVKYNVSKPNQSKCKT